MDPYIYERDLSESFQLLQPGSVITDDLSKDLRKILKESQIRDKELQAFMKGAKAVLSQKSFTDTARSIFDYCCDLIGATSGYVALLSEDGHENEVLFLEAGGLPCDVDPELPMPIRGLRAESYHTNKTVYHNDFMNSEWVKFMPEGHVVMENVMFAPLVIDEKTVGIIGLANKASDFTENDAKTATGFGELAAIALQNSKNLDQRISAEKAREKMFDELNQAYERTQKQKSELETAYERLKEMQAELVESRKQASLGNLVGGIAHEVNTPTGVGITGVSALLARAEKFKSALREKELSSGEIEDFVTFIDKSGTLVLKNLSRTANLVKTFRQLSSNSSSSEFKDVHLKAYLGEIINSLVPEFKDKTIQVDLICDESVIIHTCPGALAQIVINLMMNSFVHGFSESETGSISIKADCKKNSLKLIYHDDGKGIERNMIPKIFDPFVTSNKQKGSGLGLNIVYNLVTQTFKGTIQCESVIGKGAVFTLSLPLTSGES